MDIDRTRLGVFVTTGAVWTITVFVVARDLTPLLALIVTAYVLAASLVLSVRTSRATVQIVVPWAVAAAWWVLLILGTAGGVTLGTVAAGVFFGCLIGTVLFWAWAATGFLVLHAVRGRPPSAS